MTGRSSHGRGVDAWPNTTGSETVEDGDVMEAGWQVVEESALGDGWRSTRRSLRKGRRLPCARRTTTWPSRGARERGRR
jgi:hypothetical protein